LLSRTAIGLGFNDHIDDEGARVFEHACRLGFEGIVSSAWLKLKGLAAPATTREALDDWGT